MTAREESAPRILGPRINYRTERDNGGEALHVTVAFNAPRAGRMLEGK